jgi:indole-3-glycerol phosphate synthase / phosphoribosylanthranilate isomerase
MTEPGGILGIIVARKRRDVAARLDGVSLDDLRSRAEPTRRSLWAALALPGARFIMEVKRASPSGGELNGNADPQQMARAYRGAADAISVLTDAPFFHGSLDDLRSVRREFAGPILAKDFIVDVRQVPEARLHGADAVLVMLSVLGPSHARKVICEARRLGMDVLVEAHSEMEVRQAVALEAPIIGINNRDLGTLKLDLDVTRRLAPLVPHDRILVAESGIEDLEDLESLAPHADAFLVGSSLMLAERPAQAARLLAFGRVKVCGLTDPLDADAVASAGASYAGIILVPATPRAVERDTAMAIAQAARERGLAMVGVFRGKKVTDVAIAARELELDAVQLHGEEDARYISALRNIMPNGTEIWAASPVGTRVPRPRAGADRTLFDSEANGRSGGTGIAFDWSRLKDRAAIRRGILAGGLNPGNARAAARVGAFALDVSSGVESAPGRKDEGRMRAFFEALRLPVRGERPRCG